MEHKYKIYFMILIFVIPSLVAAPLEISDNASALEISLPITGTMHQLTLVSLFPMLIGGEVVGSIAIYDDPNTKNPGDLRMYYDNAGDILVMYWFDKFGIGRLALDRGVFERSQKPQKEFVVFLEGDWV